MINLKTWLSAIERPDAIYVQAYIFGVDYGYISTKSLILTNLENDVVVQYDLTDSSNGIYLSRYVQRIKPTLNTNFKLELRISVLDYDTNNIVNYVEEVLFKTPVSWTDYPSNQFDLIATKSLLPGKSSIEPTITATVNGSSIPSYSILRICGSNSTSSVVSFNSFDAMKEYVLDGTENVFINTFKLDTSGGWNFKVFLKLPDNTLFSSEALQLEVGQGDILINEIVENDTILKLQTGERFNTNQMIGTKRVGTFTINDIQTFQTGTFYEFYNGWHMTYFEFKNILETSTLRIPTVVELNEYYLLKDVLVGVEDIYYYSSELGSSPGLIKAVSFLDGSLYEVGYDGWKLPGNSGNTRVRFLLVEGFENNIATPDPLVIPVFRGSNLNLQPSGFKITDMAKNTDLLNFMDINSLVNPIELMSIDVEPYLDDMGGTINYNGALYYNSTTKLIYPAESVMPGFYVWIESLGQPPKTRTLYNYSGLSYIWDGINMVRLGVNPSVGILLENFEISNY